MATTGSVDPRGPHGNRPSRSALWFGFLGAPSAWLVHLAGGAALVPVACETGSEIGLHLLTVSTAVVALAAALVARRNRAPGPAPARPVTFLAGAGSALGVLFAALIILEGLLVFFLGPCR